MYTARGVNAEGNANLPLSTWQKMNIRPRAGYHVRPDGIDRHLVLNVAAYVPWSFGLDQAGALDVFVPGAMCVQYDSALAMVEVCNRPIESLVVLSNQNVPDEPSPLLDFYEVRLVPHLANQYGNNFRAARWGDFGHAEGAREIRFVRFAPGQLKFVVTEQVPGMEGSGRDSGGPYDGPGWLAAFARYGLIPGKIYEVEYVYDLPYIKVRGVDLVMCAEVWSPMRLEEYQPQFPNAEFEARAEARMAQPGAIYPVQIWTSDPDNKPEGGT